MSVVISWFAIKWLLWIDYFNDLVKRLMKHPQTYSVNHPEPLLSSTESFFIFLSGLKWTENCYCDVNFWFVRMTSVCLLSGCSYVNVYIKMHIHSTVILCKLIMVFRNKRKRLDISDSDRRHTVFLTFFDHNTLMWFLSQICCYFCCIANLVLC